MWIGIAQSIVHAAPWLEHVIIQRGSLLEVTVCTEESMQCVALTTTARCG